jgi:uncharacterized protein YcfJ
MGVAVAGSGVAVGASVGASVGSLVGSAVGAGVDVACVVGEAASCVAGAGVGVERADDGMASEMQEQAMQAVTSEPRPTMSLPPGPRRQVLRMIFTIYPRC